MTVPEHSSPAAARLSLSDEALSSLTPVSSQVDQDEQVQGKDGNQWNLKLSVSVPGMMGELGSWLLE